MQKIEVDCPAKLNLALDIVGLNEKNYHLMQMVMQSIDLYDRLTVEKTEQRGIHLSCSIPTIPCDERNIAYRCAEAFFQFVKMTDFGLHIHIEKRIPNQAGMAGGSADGAGVLVGLNALYTSGLSIQTLCGIGEKIGADIPFCLVGGTAKVEGIGEQITPLPPLPDCAIVVVKPRKGISTQKAFAAFDHLGLPPKLQMDAMLWALDRQDLPAVCQEMYNALEQVCKISDVQTIKNRLTSSGAKAAMMTGSGSAVFGIFLDRHRAYECELKLRARYPESFLCSPVGHGAVIVNKIKSF